MPLFLFFGSRNVRRTLQQGEFRCPRCRSVQRYERVFAQPHAHVYFVPLFKVGQGQEYVRCEQCRGRFHPSVLGPPIAAVADRAGSGPAADQRAGLVAATAAALSAVALADGPASEVEVEAIARELGDVAGARVAVEDVRRAVAATAAGDVERAARVVRAAAVGERSEVREAIVTALLRVSAAEGDPSPAAAAAVRQLASALDVTPVHLRGIVADLSG